MRQLEITYTFHTMGLPVNTHKRMAFEKMCPAGLTLNRNDGVGDRVMQVFSSIIIGLV
jgi:hypothetical protein